MSTSSSRIVAVVGGSGAGKSWLVHQVCSVLGDLACHLALDDFYRDRSHLPLARRARLNFDVPGAIDWTGAAKVLRDCRAGLPTQVPRYDFATYSRVAVSEPWCPRPVVLVDGLWLLRFAELRRLFDLSIFLDTPASIRNRRRVERDTAERGYSAEAVQQRLVANVWPMHERYVEPQKRWADLILAQPYSPDQVRILARRVWRLLDAHTPLPIADCDTFAAELGSLLLDHEYCN